METVEELVPARKIARALGQRDDEPVGPGFVKLPEEMVEVKIVDRAVEVRRSFLRRVALRSDEVVTPKYNNNGDIQ